MLYQLIASAVILIVGFVLRGVAGSFVGKKVRGQQLKPQSALLARKIITALIIVVVVLALGLVWNVAPENIWISLASIIALVAIGFFAVWCILSNIVAGLILVISRPFDIGDEVLFLPDNIQGTVTNITAIFLVLEDHEGSVVFVPNNLAFQRIVKRLRKKDVE